MWGCLPQEKGVSKVKIFVLTKKRKGIIGAIKNMFLYALTLLLLKTLTDDDVKAFPNMRFNNNYLLKSDESVARFIQVTNSLEIFPHNHGSEYEH